MQVEESTADGDGSHDRTIVRARSSLDLKETFHHPFVPPFRRNNRSLRGRTVEDLCKQADWTSLENAIYYRSRDSEARARALAEAFSRAKT